MTVVALPGGTLRSMMLPNTSVTSSVRYVFSSHTRRNSRDRSTPTNLDCGYSRLNSTSSFPVPQPLSTMQPGFT
jgi:hypothetical protein